MLQILYLIAFALISFLALRNLVGSLVTLGAEQQKAPRRRRRPVPHPELINDDGEVTDEPLLVIRQTSLDEARSRLDSLYYESPDDMAER